MCSMYRITFNKPKRYTFKRFVDKFFRINSQKIDYTAESLFYFNKAGYENETRRERLKSALYLTLKKRKTFFLEKKLEFFENIFLLKNVA